MPKVFGTNKRLKVVWLCHLNNEFITQQLGIKPSFEFAPWVSRFAEIFEKFNEVDVHIVAPHNQIFKEYSFTKNNIHYHFFPYIIPFIPKRISNWLHVNSNYLWNRLKIRGIVKKINPDLIHLFGTENAYFTSSIFQFNNKYPVLITIQGFAKYVQGNSKTIIKRKKVEVEIIKSFNNFGVRDEEMKGLIKGINPKANFFHHEIAPYIPKASLVAEEDKEYDIIFFARVVKTKGIEDLIQSVAIAKKKIRNLKLVVVGPITNDYKDYLLKLTDKLKLLENIVFIGPKDSIEDVHRILAKSRITVLPTYTDTIPGTIIESMLVGVPCISYPVGGIPTLNKDVETLKLVEKGNIESLSNEIINLLEDESLRKSLSDRAKEQVSLRWNDNAIHRSIVTIYHKTLDS